MTEHEDDKQAQFHEAYENKASELSDQQLHRSAQNLFFEGKRFAKTNRLLIEYMMSCFSITNNAQALYEPEIGIDNAMELIAYLESPEKCRKLQNDYDEDYYEYLVSRLSACAYDNLAVHTAMRLGYNSPTVFGAVDDGIQVCRRTGKLECVECFREYATRISLASGDYEMGEHHARLCATSTAREDADDRRYVGHKDLIKLFVRQGKLQAAFDVYERIFPFAESYHDPLNAMFTCAIRAEMLFWLAGKENELPEFMAAHELNELPKIPPREEHAEYYIETTLRDAVKLARQARWLEAVDILDQCERFLVAQDVLNPWFEIRIAKIANLLLAKKHGLEIPPGLDHFIAEVKSRAKEAHHWSAIQAVEAMEKELVALNPLGIAFPIDLGPYATTGTATSHAKLELMLPLVDISTGQASAEQNSEQAESAEVTVQTPIQEQAEKMYSGILALIDEQRKYYQQLLTGEIELENGQPKPFPKQGELFALERDYLAFAESFHPEDTKLSSDEFLDIAKPLSQLFLLDEEPQLMEKVWKWNTSFRSHYPESARLIAHYALDAFLIERKALEQNLDPQSFGLPDKETYFKWIEQAFALDPNNYKVAIAAGLMYRGNKQDREARRYFSRACQLARTNEFATNSLCELYAEADRPKDALAAIELYTRAGGRHPQLLLTAARIAFQNDMASQFLLYYDAYTKESQSDMQLDAQYVWALMETQRYDDVLTQLDHFDEAIQKPSRDRLYLRAYCLAKTGKEWTDCFEAALNLVSDDGALEGVPGVYWDPCGPLWEFVSQWAKDDPRRLAFEQFILIRGLIPMSFFEPESQDAKQCECSVECDELEENESDEYAEEDMLTLFRCVVRQPLKPEVTAYAGWANILPEAHYYDALWFVLANDPEEATQIALQWQQKCYELAPEPNECEAVGEFGGSSSRVFAQGRRMWGEEVDDEIDDEDSEFDGETDE
ncbi:MAG: hypothetical protein Q4G59_00205 [Planctomycetia bacterium]|nr:hypothetical protein [Planctomycetia bacterium]